MTLCGSLSAETPPDLVPALGEVRRKNGERAGFAGPLVERCFVHASSSRSRETSAGELAGAGDDVAAGTGLLPGLGALRRLDAVRRVRRGHDGDVLDALVVRALKDAQRHAGVRVVVGIERLGAGDRRADVG